jgi:hypothetical protein
MFLNVRPSGRNRATALRPNARSAGAYRRYARFVQPDPLGYDDGMNMYAYVKGDPVNFTDPMGLDRQCVSWREGGSVTSDSDGGVTVTAGRLKYACWDTDGGGGGGGGGGGIGGIEIDLATGCESTNGGQTLTCPLPPGRRPPIDPRPDPRRDRCGNPLPPASRNYSVPPGYKGGAHPQNIYVRDLQDRMQVNPYYRTAFNAGGGVNVGGVISDLGWIGRRVAESLLGGAIARRLLGERVGGAVGAGNRVLGSAAEAARGAGGPCSR